MAPDVATFCPPAVIKKIALYFLIGYLPFYRVYHDTLQLPFYNQDYIDDIYMWRGNGFGQKVYLASVKFLDIISKLIFFHLRQRRIFVFYYSINNRKDFTTAISRGIDGIITDTPELLLSHI